MSCRGLYSQNYYVILFLLAFVSTLLLNFLTLREPRDKNDLQNTATLYSKAGRWTKFKRILYKIALGINYVIVPIISTILYFVFLEANFHIIQG